MAVKRYDGSAWQTVAGLGAQGAAGASGTAGLTTKGDLLGYSTTATRLAVGSDGDTLLADSSATTGLRWQGHIEAGKNALINGGFDIWQRGTSSTTGSGYLTADRWYLYAGSTVTWSRESTTVPAGSLYSMKVAAGASIQPIIHQAIETQNAIQFAGKNVVFSVLAQASTSTGITIDVQYSTSADVGPTGSWTSITASSGGSGTATSSGFTKISGVFAVPSTAKSLMVRIYSSSNIANGVNLFYGQAQLELGSVATEFSRAGGTLAGELAACQRYYQKSYDPDDAPASTTGKGKINFTSPNRTDQYAIEFNTTHRVTMRGLPTLTIYSPSTGTAARVRDEIGGADRAVVAKNIGFNNGQVEGDSGVTTTANALHSFQWVASAEL